MVSYWRRSQSIFQVIGWGATTHRDRVNGRMTRLFEKEVITHYCQGDTQKAWVRETGLGVAGVEREPEATEVGELAQERALSMGQGQGSWATKLEEQAEEEKAAGETGKSQGDREGVAEKEGGVWTPAERTGRLRTEQHWVKCSQGRSQLTGQ